MTVDDLVFSLSPAFLSYSGGGLRGGSFAVRRGRVVVRRFSAVRGMWMTGTARRGVLRLRIGGRAAAHGRVTMRSGGRVTGRLGGRAIRVRLPGYGATPRRSAGASAPPPATRPGGVFGAPLVAKSSRSRLVPLRVR